MPTKKPNRRRKQRIILELSEGEREALDTLVIHSEFDTMASYLRWLIKTTAAAQTLK